MSMFTSIVAAVAGASLVAASPTVSKWTPPSLCGNAHDYCPSNVGLSCTGTNDTCCQENTFGIFMGTQFWDYNPATGPADLFTTHGLWSNKCAGGYGTYCNPAWEVENVTQTLQDLGQTKLLKEMSYSWKNNEGTDEDLWMHEFNKHGTCMATVNPDCYLEDAPKYQYVADYFTSAVALQKTIPTYEFLKKSGIVPTTEKQYATADIRAAIKKGFGYNVSLSCDSDGALSEVWYYFSLKGAVASGTFIPAAAQALGTTCNDTLWYIPKGETVPGSSSGSDSQVGTLTLGSQSGCLVASGAWSTSATCASFTLADATFGGVSLNSSAGPCNIVDGVFSCAASNSLAQFTTSGSSILYNGDSNWSAASVPASGSEVSIAPGSGSVTFTLTFTA